VETETVTEAPPAVPRAGQLTTGWRYATGGIWFLVFVAYCGVWKASRELGLATWWLGPVSEPQPIFVMLLPLLGPAVMVMATLSNARRLPWFGLVASAFALLVALPDLGRVRRLGIAEVAIAVAGALVSVAAFSGTYRRVATS
jgi:hypothetical protein